jgi:hypothetical protein
MICWMGSGIISLIVSITSDGGNESDSVRNASGIFWILVSLTNEKYHRS